MMPFSGTQKSRVVDAVIEENTMQTTNHFWFVSKLFSFAYILIGSGLSSKLLQDSNWLPIFVVGTASAFMAVGHWRRRYWAISVTTALVFVVNIFSVPYFFPVFGGTGEKSIEEAVIAFSLLTAISITIGLYFYLNQNKMIGKNTS